jgi:hypothetical protein
MTVDAAAPISEDNNGCLHLFVYVMVKDIRCIFLTLTLNWFFTHIKMCRF